MFGFGMVLVGLVHLFGRSGVWFWYCFAGGGVWFWYGFGMVLVAG